MAQQTRGYAHRVDIRADIAEVWRSLVEPARLTRWYAPQARVDAREGGSYWVRIDADLTREAHIDICQPPRRLRLIYMPFPDLPDEGAVIVEDFLLDRDPTVARTEGVSAVTILRLMGSGIPQSSDWHSTYVALRRGWERALLRLKVLLERPPGRAGPSFKPLTGL